MMAPESRKRATESINMNGRIARRVNESARIFTPNWAKNAFMASGLPNTLLNKSFMELKSILRLSVKPVKTAATSDTRILIPHLPASLLRASCLNWEALRMCISSLK